MRSAADLKTLAVDVERRPVQPVHLQPDHQTAFRDQLLKERGFVLRLRSSGIIPSNSRPTASPGAVVLSETSASPSATANDHTSPPCTCNATRGLRRTCATFTRSAVVENRTTRASGSHLYSMVVRWG